MILRNSSQLGQHQPRDSKLNSYLRPRFVNSQCGTTPTSRDKVEEPCQLVPGRGDLELIYRPRLRWVFTSATHTRGLVCECSNISGMFYIPRAIADFSVPSLRIDRLLREISGQLSKRNERTRQRAAHLGSPNDGRWIKLVNKTEYRSNARRQMTRTLQRNKAAEDKAFDSQGRGDHHPEARYAASYATG
jgi:hypothetical protein